MFAIGDIVRVLPPFDDFAGQYSIVEINQGGVIFLDGLSGGFSPDYLEKV